MEKHHKRDTEKKNSKRIEDAEQVHVKSKALTEGRSVGPDGDNGDNGDATSDAERKREKREKNKNEGNKSKIRHEGESVSVGKSGEEGKKKRKRQKLDEEIVSEILVDTVRKDNNDDYADKAERKKKKRKKTREQKEEVGLSHLQIENEIENVEHDVQSDRDVTKKLEGKKKKKKKYEENGNIKDDASAPQQDMSVHNSVENNKEKKKKKKYKENGKNKDDSSAPQQNMSMQKFVENDNKEKKKKKKKQKKCKQIGNNQDDTPAPQQDMSMLNSVENDNKEKKKKKKKTEVVEDGSDNPTPNKSNKKVRFSGDVEVFTLPDISNTNMMNVNDDGLVIGRRFTSEEDEIVKKAVHKYIMDHDLGDEGLDMVLNCKKHPLVRGCWKEIGLAIPYRPYIAIYYRAQVLFRRAEQRKWTQEEYEQILQFQKEHGNQWKVLADELGKHRWHVKDTWRRIKLPNQNLGHWTQAEYQQLFNLVNEDLKMKINETKRSKHGMLRDNICWTAVSDQLATRTQMNCCIKWYNQLTSRMVAEGIWADTDDYLLVAALYSLDATCVEDVEWDDLLDDRAGDLCRKRWSQMVRHIGIHGTKSFGEQVEVLAKRYCPEMLEAREIWDNKPRVP